jgi:hypothetical protein
VEDFFKEFEERPELQSVVVEGVELEKGSRVLLLPRPGGDIMDVALADKVAFVEGIEQDYEDRIYAGGRSRQGPGRCPYPRAPVLLLTRGGRAAGP